VVVEAVELMVDVEEVEGVEELHIMFHTQSQ